MTRVSVRLLVAGALCAVSAMIFGSLASASGSQIPKTGTGIARTGAFGQGTAGEEFAFDDEDGPAAFDGTISLSSGSGGGPNIVRRHEGEVEPYRQYELRGAELLPAALLARRESVLDRAARPGSVRRQRLRARSHQRRGQHLQRVGAVGPTGQHRHEHRRRVPAQRQPRGRPELVLRVSARGRPFDRDRRA